MFMHLLDCFGVINKYRLSLLANLLVFGDYHNGATTTFLHVRNVGARDSLYEQYA